MTEYEKMILELPYNAMKDDSCQIRMRENRIKLYDYNNLDPRKSDEQDILIKRIIGSCGEHIHIEPPFHCDYGKHIEIGDYFYANYNLCILDVAKVKIGHNVMCGPNVSIYTAGHPVHPEVRNSLLEYGISITIGNNVWIGGNTVILPGVHIGDNTVIGAGSIVTKDIGDNVIACGNPCKVIRKITEEDRKYYYKDREI